MSERKKHPSITGNFLEMKQWEEVIGKVRNVEESKETLTIELSLASALIIRLPREKVSGIVLTRGQQVCIIRTDSGYRIKVENKEQVNENWKRMNSKEL